MGEKEIGLKWLRRALAEAEEKGQVKEAELIRNAIIRNEELIKERV